MNSSARILNGNVKGRDQVQNNSEYFFFPTYHTPLQDPVQQLIQKQGYKGITPTSNSTGKIKKNTSITRPRPSSARYNNEERPTIQVPLPQRPKTQQSFVYTQSQTSQKSRSGSDGIKLLKEASKYPSKKPTGNKKGQAPSSGTMVLSSSTFRSKTSSNGPSSSTSTALKSCPTYTKVANPSFSTSSTSSTVKSNLLNRSPPVSPLYPVSPSRSASVSNNNVANPPTICLFPPTFGGDEPEVARGPKKSLKSKIPVMKMKNKKKSTEVWSEQSDDYFLSWGMLMNDPKNGPSPSPSPSYHTPNSHTLLQERSKSQPFLLRMPVDLYPPEKAKWVQLALEKLQSTGTITVKQMNSREIQNRVGMLYDITLDNKVSQVKLSIERMLEDKIQGNQKVRENQQIPTTPVKKKVSISDNVTALSTPRMNNKKQTPSRTPKRITKSKPSSKLDPDVNANVDNNISSSSGKPTSSDEPPEAVNELQKKISDILLSLLLKGMMTESNKVDDILGNLKTSLTTDAKDVGTNTEEEADEDNYYEPLLWIAKYCGVSLNKKLKNGTSIQDVVAPWIGDMTIESLSRDICPCFVNEGRILPVKRRHDSSRSLRHSFASASQSKRRTCPELVGYFRSVIDLRGFEPEEISLKCLHNKIFIEAKRDRDAETDRNFRLVREVLELPSSLGLGDLRVMRGKNSGRLIFEEIVNSRRSSRTNSASTLTGVT